MLQTGGGNTAASREADFPNFGAYDQMRTFTSSAVLFSAADLGSGVAPLAIGDTVAPVVVEPAKRDNGIAAKREAKSNVAAPKRNAAKPKADASAKPASKPGKRAAADATEAKPDPRVARAERIAAERSDIRALYAAFEAQRASVPVKALSAFKPQPSTPHNIDRNPSPRQAAAICAALAGAGVKLADGAKAPRVFEHNGVRVCVENGVMRDALASGLISVTGGSPETEIITVRAKQAAIIGGLLGAKIIKAAKLAA